MDLLKIFGINNPAQLIEDKIEDTYEFYNKSENGQEISPSKRIYTHRFLIYTSLMNYTWQITYGVSLLNIFFGDEKTTTSEYSAMAAASSLIVSSYITYGAFWSKLGDKKLLNEAWEKEKLKTIGKIVKNNVIGSIVHPYYKANFGIELIKDSAYYCLEKICQEDSLRSRVVFGVFNWTYKFSNCIGGLI